MRMCRLTVPQCVLAWDAAGERWSLTDTSSNGVTVNSVAVGRGGRVLLQPGDSVVLSDLPDKYRCGPSRIKSMRQLTKIFIGNCSVSV